MAVNITGVIVVVIFYSFVFAIGIWGSVRSRKRKSRTSVGQLENSLLANRSVGLIMGVFTMSATWIGGGFVMGTVESLHNPTKGLLWGLFPLQLSMAFIVGGLFFTKPMRDGNYITMMDPFERKYGKTLTAVFAVVAIVSEVMWVPMVQISIGVTVSVFSNLPLSLCIWISAAVAIIYTMLGGLYSVAFTDVIQLALVFGSLWLCAPFVLASNSYTGITWPSINNTHQPSWLGKVGSDNVGRWMDEFLLRCIGCLAFQDFHQRTLSSSSTSTARIICFVAAGVVIIVGIPPLLIGAIAASVDWNTTTYGAPSPYDRGEAAMTFPIILQNLTPTVTFYLGMGAIAAAAMSSADSSLLAAASIFTTTIYKTIRPQVSEREQRWVIRISILVVGIVGTSLTHLSNSIVTFWRLNLDLSYTLMLPQLICILFFRVSNGYGAVIGVTVAFVMRVLCGEPLFNLPIVLHFPGSTLEDGVYVQRWPFKTTCMLSALVSILTVSCVSSVLFNKGILPDRWDVFKVKSQGAPKPADSARGQDIESNEDEEFTSEPMLTANFLI